MAPLIGLLFVEGNKGTRSAAAEAEKFEPSLKLDIHYIHHSLLHAHSALSLRPGAIKCGHFVHVKSISHPKKMGSVFHAPRQTSKKKLIAST